MNMMGINNSRMMSGDMDRNFIEQMIARHESALAMAKLAQQKSISVTVNVEVPTAEVQ